MRVIIAGGGTGGHLFPGIALARGLVKCFPESKALFIGTSRLLDQETLRRFGFELAALHCGGLKGLGLLERVRNLILMGGATYEAMGIIRRFKPDLVFGVGGYVSAPVVLAARLLRVPVALHEQNAIAGMANRFTGRLAQRICISLPCSPPFPQAKTLWTGNPVRQEILEAGERRAQQKSGEAPSTLLVLGGSQGAHQVNMLMAAAMERLIQQHAGLRIIHQTGERDQEEVARRYAAAGVQAEVSAFIQDMAGAYSQADLAISRAGATTLAELAVMGLPALLIPYPYAADLHQHANAAHYVRGGGAALLEESQLTAEILAETISQYLHKVEELRKMAAQMRTLSFPEATEHIIDACLQLASPGSHVS